MTTLLPDLGRLRARFADPTRMGSVDRAWLRMEVPTNLMVVNALLTLDGPLPVEELRALVAERLGWIQRMRLRARPGLLWHRWDEQELELEAHVVQTELPEPRAGASDNDDALRELVSRLASAPLDAGRPPWQLRVIHNYRAAGAPEPSAPVSVVLCRVHHALGDGLALLLVLISLTEASAAGGHNPLHDLFVRGDARAIDAARRFIEELMPTGMRLMLRRDHGSLLEQRGERARREPSLLRSIARSARLGKALVGDLASLLLRAPDSSTVFRGSLDVDKRLAWSRPIALDAVRSLHRSLDATVNDVLLAAMTGGLRRYLLERGESPAGVELRAAVPINLRSLAQMPQLGNRFGLVFVALPVGLADPRERLAELRRRMDALKHSVEPAVTFGILGLIGAGPALVERLVMAHFAKRVSFVMTNVPGPERALYLAGRAIEGVMFWVPQSGRVGLGVSIFSYAGTLRLGVACDAGLVPDPHRLIAGFHEELDAMLALG